MRQRDKGPARERAKQAGAPPGNAGRGGERRRVSDRGANLDAIADRIVAEYGVDRDRAVASADLYMRQLRRSVALAGY